MKEVKSIAEIVSLTSAAFESSFQPGERADPNFVTKCLYEYQCRPNPSNLVGEVKQDIVWAALEINPDPLSWGITLDQYESAMTIINPTFARVKAAGSYNKYLQLCTKFWNRAIKFLRVSSD